LMLSGYFDYVCSLMLSGCIDFVARTVELEALCHCRIACYSNCLLV
jgi:hypothetical protein